MKRAHNPEVITYVCPHVSSTKRRSWFAVSL